jgi:hypothetical protein
MNKLLFLLIVSVVLSGCGLNLQKKDVNEKGNNITVAGKEGETLTFGAKELPSNFPLDVPVFPGAKPTGSYAASGENAGMIVALESSDDSKKISDYYKIELVKNGWEVKEQTQGSAPTAVYSIKKGLRAGTVSVTKGENNTKIAIMIGKEE